MSDQYIQEWNSLIAKSASCLNYRIFKYELSFENYLNVLSFKLRKALTKFRCRNTKFPVVTGSYYNVPYENRYCNKCAMQEIGDEYHYMFICNHFAIERKLFLKKFYLSSPSAVKLQYLFNSNGQKLINLCKFIVVILERCE